MKVRTFRYDLQELPFDTDEKAFDYQLTLIAMVDIVNDLHCLKEILAYKADGKVNQVAFVVQLLLVYGRDIYHLLEIRISFLLLGKIIV